MSGKKEQNNIIYILTNETMPGLIKIGTTNGTVEQRMQELYKSGVPVPFECFHASVVADAKKVERKLHDAFDDSRVNKNREFFEIAPERVLSILELVEVKDITPVNDYIETEDDKIAIEKIERKREKFNFNMVQIKIGSELTFLKDESKKCIVLDNNKVLFNNKETSLSKAAKEALVEMNINWKSVQGPSYWTYHNETLWDRRVRMEEE